MKTAYLLSLVVPACALLATPCFAQEKLAGPDRYAATVRNADLNPATPSAARRTLDRIDAAALAACGAPSFSLSEVTLALRRTPCWRNAMEDAIGRIGNPMLLDAYRRRTGK